MIKNAIFKILVCQYFEMAIFSAPIIISYDLGFQKQTVSSDGHDKPFCTKAITIIDNFKNALGDTDNR